MVDMLLHIFIIELNLQVKGGCSSVVERFVANEEVVGSIPTTRSKFKDILCMN